MKVKSKDYLFVTIQFILFGLFILNFDWNFGLTFFIKSIGLVFSIFGFLVALIAVLQLNTKLSPFPTPKENAVLLENGLFQFVRHPIYSGLLLLFYGYGLYLDSIYKIVITSILLLLFYFKTNYEEIQLERKFPDYIIYKQKVGRFFPKINQ
jgi:protein-S-isoprenylcysteine O-methyltransferase Ste14